MEDNAILNSEWVRETRFGRWFLSSDTWVRYVLLKAVQDFSAMLGDKNTKVSTVLDAGCGEGLAFNLIEQHFSPETIVAIDIDSELLELAKDVAKKCSVPVTLKNVLASNLGIEDDSIDIIFCHQLLHHTGKQKAALQEFMRVLAPGGVLLVAESCHEFINSLPVRLLFKHPKMAQKDAPAYVKLVRDAGFLVETSEIQATTPWWSRIDLGLLEKWGLSKGPRVPTEILFIARKPN